MNMYGYPLLFVLFLAFAENTSMGDAPLATTQKPCRLMINWDQMDLCALQLTFAHRNNPPTAETVKSMIEEIVDEHSKAKIDRMVHCVFALPRGTVPSGFKSFYRDTIPEKLFENVPVGFEALEAAGFDRIRITMDRARKDEIEFLGGIRMNDRHSHTSPFLEQHPEWQLPEFPGGMDYKHSGVREAVLSFIDEFLEKYDVDGLELDWMRWCHVFRPSEAKQNAPLLTEFVQSIRQRLDQAAAKHGRSRLLLGVRVPQAVSECLALGYDVGAWIRSGSIDYVCPSDFFFTDFNIKVEEFVNLVEGTKVLIYPSIHPLISWGNEHHLQTRESYRAAANNYFAFGAHGISVYNYQYHWRADKGKEDDWPGALNYLTALKAKQETAQGNRHYMFHPMWSGHGDGTGPSGAIRDVRLKLSRQSKFTDGMDLRLSENPEAKNVKIELQFKVTGLANSDDLQLAVNGSSISSTQIKRVSIEGQSAQQGRVLPRFELFSCLLKVENLLIGDNRLVVTLIPGKAAEGESPEVVIQEIEVLVTTLPSK